LRPGNTRHSIQQTGYQNDLGCLSQIQCPFHRASFSVRFGQYSTQENGTSATRSFPCDKPHNGIALRLSVERSWAGAQLFYVKRRFAFPEP
jgi:hypothetical protein